MPRHQLISWNVNGLRAVHKKGFMDWLLKTRPHALCLQETKASPDQLDPGLLSPPGYFSCFSTAARKGYSGTAIYTRIKPRRMIDGMGIDRFDEEGRLTAVDLGSYWLYSVYFPNGKASKERLQYKMEFYEAFQNHVLEKTAQGQTVIVCGDVNTAHREIDLARPKENESVSGFLPMERAWIDRFLASGFVDSFRLLHPDEIQYSWWDYKTRARERNIGWRIDYFLVSANAGDRIVSASILRDVTGSDHCPVALEFRAG